MREARISRRTRETDIEISLLLDGTGKAEIECGDRFLEHMLETLAKYASFDLKIAAEGDDDHHLTEDVAIVLGKAMREAMGDAPTQRIASATVPMDDALVTVALDVIERAYTDVDCPDPLFHHFFRSLSMSSGITLHIVQERGFDDHHVVEASFKALGLALRKALSPRGELLSTKDRPETRSN